MANQTFYGQMDVSVTFFFFLTLPHQLPLEEIPDAILSLAPVTVITCVKFAS